MIPASKQMWQVAPCVTVGPVTDPDVAIADLVAAAVEAADLRPLVLALFHHTGDERWLQEPYVPRRDVRLIADPAAGFPPEVQEEIKAEARRVFADGTASVVVDDPGRDRFHENAAVAQRELPFCKRQELVGNVKVDAACCRGEGEEKDER